MKKDNLNLNKLVKISSLNDYSREQSYGKVLSETKKVCKIFQKRKQVKI